MTFRISEIQSFKQWLQDTRQDNYTTFQNHIRSNINWVKNGFIGGRSCIDNVFILKQTIQKRREFNVEGHMAFLDLGKAFDRVNRNQPWQILNRIGTPYHLIEVIKSLYKNASVQIDTGRKILNYIYIYMYIYIYIYIYILIKEYDKDVIYQRLSLIFT
jgi:hypothetical protein